MEHHAGIDVSLEWSSVCVVNASGKIVREIKIASEPEVLVEFFKGLSGYADRARSGAAVSVVARRPEPGWV
jgi:transposase